MKANDMSKPTGYFRKDEYYRRFRFGRNTFFGCGQEGQGCTIQDELSTISRQYRKMRYSINNPKETK